MSKLTENKKKIICIVFWSSIFVYLIIQHSFVWLYFDDYGYASITYLGEQFNPSHGRNYSLLQILSFLKFHYLNWGGRVVAYFFEILCLRYSIWIFRIIQSALIFFMLLFMVRIVDYKKDKSIVTALTVVGMYFLIGLPTVNWGTYWFSASVTYIWTSCFFFAGIYYQQKIKLTKLEEKKNYFLFVLFMALSAVMYEQASVAVIVYLFFTELVFPILEKRVSYYNIIAIIICYVSAAFCILAPGNFARMGASEEFNNLSLWGKITHNLPIILMINLEDRILMTVLFALTGVLASTVIGKRMRNMLSRYLYILVTAVISIWMILELTNIISIGKYYAEICWVIVFSINILGVLAIKRETAFVSLYLAGIMTQGMMLVTTQLNFRVRILFVLVLIVLCSDIIRLIISIDKYHILRTLAVGTFICGVCCTLRITYGYYNNNVMNYQNNIILSDYKDYLYFRGDEQIIDLYKLSDDRFACMMPYQAGGEFGGTLMRYYYNIPQDIIFNWIDY